MKFVYYKIQQISSTRTKENTFDIVFRPKEEFMNDRIKASVAVTRIHDELGKWAMELITSGHIDLENDYDQWKKEFVDRLGVTQIKLSSDDGDHYGR